MAVSEFEHARARCPGVPDDVLIEGLIERLGLDAELQPPTDLHRAASYQDIKEIQVVEMDFAGMLTPVEGGGFIIKVRREDKPHRRNFTIGHEITHTLLPGYTMVQHRCGGRGVRDVIGDRHLENLADIGAAELLLPRRFLQPVFADLPFNMQGVKAVAEQHHASLDATLRRLLRLPDRHAIVIDLRESGAPDDPLRTTVHRVFSNSEWCSVAPLQLHGKRVPAGHPVNDILRSIDATDVVDLSFLQTTSPSAHISAISDPYIDNEGKTVMRSLVLATPRQTRPIHFTGNGRLPVAS